AFHQLKVLLTFGSEDTRFEESLVPMFFALSGFLVTGSAFRTQSVATFLSFRVLRIVPALFTEVFLSAMLLGPLLTTFTLQEYFSDPLFRVYFYNIVGHVQFTLPGLFHSNPIPAVVNGNLWTLPPEFYCYFLTAISMVFGLLFSRRSFTAIFAILTPLVIYTHPKGQDILNPLYCFFCGVLLYHWRYQIRYSKAFLLVSAAVCSWQFSRDVHIYLFPLLLAYVTVFVGVTAFPKIPIIDRQDYSYGIYLYGFPITQALILLLPSLKTH